MMMSAAEMNKRLARLKEVGILRDAGGPRFYCDICKKPFPSATALIAHGQKAHGR